MMRKKSYKLPKAAGHFVMPLILSLFMSCVVSGISTFHSVGLTAEALRLWPGAWAFSWVVAFPVLLLVLPVVRRIVGLIVEN